MTVMLTTDYEHGGRVIDGYESVRQRVYQRLRFATGEWFLNPTAGIPYFSEILGRRGEAVAVRAIRTHLQRVPDVLDVGTVDIVYDEGDRIVSVDAIVTTRFGVVAASTGL